MELTTNNDMEQNRYKFRAWDGEHMISPDYITRDGKGHWIENSIPSTSSVLMQFTGLTDKNGVEVFEGDQLFICAGYSSAVEFQDGMFVSVYKHPEDGETIPLIDAIGKDTYVIGNIHQQPNLIDKV